MELNASRVDPTYRPVPFSEHKLQSDMKGNIVARSQWLWLCPVKLLHTLTGPVETR